MCGHEFISERTNEDAIAEAMKLWPGVPRERFEPICDECYKKHEERINSEYNWRKELGFLD